MKWLEHWASIRRGCFTGVFFLGCALAGLGGAVQLPKGGADLLMDFNILSAIFVVVVIGGMGSLPGAYVAAGAHLRAQRIRGKLPAAVHPCFDVRCYMVVVLIFRPFGLFGREEVAGEHGQVGEPERPIKPAGQTARDDCRGGLGPAWGFCRWWAIVSFLS